VPARSVLLPAAGCRDTCRARARADHRGCVDGTRARRGRLEQDRVRHPGVPHGHRDAADVLGGHRHRRRTVLLSAGHGRTRAVARGPPGGLRAVRRGLRLLHLAGLTTHAPARETVRRQFGRQFGDTVTMSDHNGRVLVVGALPPWLQAAVNEHDPLVLPGEGERDAFLAQHAESVHVAVTTAFAGVGSELMAALPNLRAVINFGTGCDSTDLAQAERRGIGVSNTPDVLTDCVADTAVALLLDAMRGFAASDRYVRQGRWETEGPFRLTRKVGGSLVGILGLGRIGRAV